MFLVLNPKEKMGYFKRHWAPNLQDDVATCIEEVVRENISLSLYELICYSSRSGGYY
jgi:hypothetical protein